LAAQKKNTPLYPFPLQGWGKIQLNYKNVQTNNSLSCCGSLVLQLFSGQVWFLRVEYSRTKRNLCYKISVGMNLNHRTCSVEFPFHKYYL